MGEAFPEKIYYRIGEVSRITGIKPFVLRYWETEFPRLSPLRRGSRQRLYRQEDVELVLQIKKMLYQDKYTIAGAKRMLEAKSSRSTADGTLPSAGAAAGGEASEQVKKVREFRTLVKEVHQELGKIVKILQSK